MDRHWQYVGHKNQLSDVGSVIETEIAGQPVIVVRESVSSIRAFYNVCKHRGGPLCVKRGTSSVLQCQYHGWTYKLDGSLRGVPHFNHVELFDKSDFGLQPIPLVEWQGLLFVSTANAPSNFDTHVDGIAERIFPINMSDWRFAVRDSYKVNCNWKVYVDNYLEGYHIPMVHPELNKILDYSQYVTETSDWYSLQYSPVKDGAEVYGADADEAFYYFLYPNMMLNVMAGRLQMNLVVPVSASQCEVIFDYFYADTQSEAAKQRLSSDRDYSNLVQQEDIEICERVQNGLASKAYDQGRFSVKFEEGVYHFQNLLKNDYKRALKELK